MRRTVADPADIAHLLRRTEFVARPARVGRADATLDSTRRSTTCSTSRRTAARSCRPTLTVHDDDAAWEQYVDAYHWWLDDGDPAPADPGEDDAVLARSLHQRRGTSVGRTDHMMRRTSCTATRRWATSGRLAQAMAIEPAMLIYLSQRRQREGRAEPELRP